MVKNKTNLEQVTAELRDGFFIGRALELENNQGGRSNELTARATDSAGNEITYPTSGDHEVTLDETLNVTYTYDEAGNTTQKSEEGGAKITTYTYNDENQLTQIAFPGDPSRWQKFYYDGLGRRCKLTTTGRVLQTRS